MGISTVTIILSLALFNVIAAQSKVKVDVYYESLCPDSRKFINTQLYPALKADSQERGSLYSFVDLTLIPYGKSTYNTTGADTLFTCHHGPEECYGNKVHACAMLKIEVNSFQHDHTKSSKVLQYVDCLMSSAVKNTKFPSEKCAHDVSVSNNFHEIEMCANTTEGSKELQRYGDLTNKLKPALTSVPTIVFNSQYDAVDQEQALVNFRYVVCQKLGPSKPAVCPTSASPINIAAPITIIATYFATKLL